MTDSRQFAWIALSLLPDVGIKRLHALSDAFDGDLRAALRAPASALTVVPGIGSATAAAIRALDLGAVERRLNGWLAEGVEPLIHGTPTYPDALLTLPDAPATLYLRSHLRLSKLLSAFSVGVVGTRSPSGRGAAAARALAEAVAARGWTLISGFARGVDALAQTSAARRGGWTMALLGSGVLNIYPPEHARWALSLLDAGHAFASEVPPDAEPHPRTLVSRNRIIAGLSGAVVVVESSVNGGAMHTARYGRGYGRRVAAIQFSGSSAADVPSGNRALLESGAVALHAAHLTPDALDALQPPPPDALADTLRQFPLDW